MPEYLLSTVNHKGQLEGHQFFTMKLHTIRWHFKINVHTHNIHKEIWTDFDNA